MTHHPVGPAADPTAHNHTHGRPFDAERVASTLEIEGELASSLTNEAIALCADQFAADSNPVRRVLDLGCGPGVGTARLAEKFPSAKIVAVDASAAMLARAEARVARLGLAARVEVRPLDLDGDLQTLGACDLAWAAMAIHHAGDEVATLTRIRRLLRPQGLLCVLERADPMVVRLADDVGRPGIWDRLRAARSEWFERTRLTLPGALNAERYPDMLASAGLEVVVSRTLTGTVTAPDDPATHRFLGAQLRKTAHNLADTADAADLEALLAYVEATPRHSDGRWDGAKITSSRKLFIARAAAGRR